MIFPDWLLLTALFSTASAATLAATATSVQHLADRQPVMPAAISKLLDSYNSKDLRLNSNIIHALLECLNR